MAESAPVLAGRAVPAAPVPHPGPAPRRRRRRSPTRYLWVLPGVGLAMFVVGYPIVSNIGGSFTDQTADGNQFVGLAHYRQILGDSHLYESLWLTAQWTLGVTAMQFTIGFLGAVMADRSSRFIRVVRPILILPWALPGVVAAYTWVFLYKEDGLFNQLLGIFGDDSRHAWLADSNTALLGVMVAAAWKGFPFYFLLLLAGLQSVPGETKEAARIDGASGWQTLVFIVIPQMRATIVTSLALGIIATSNYFDGIYLMTGGGPSGSTETLPVWIYNVAFNQFDIPKASALSVILLIVVALLLTVRGAVGLITRRSAR
ncbi:MAG TPA: sugar ABC transporter permease [Mycobacteriales bacterium]|nr:sugar ABC transporter permease [Mycobacteriales bacterium]